MVRYSVTVTLVWNDFNLEFQTGVQFSYDIKENIDYFPVIQGPKKATATLFKPQKY